MDDLGMTYTKRPNMVYRRIRDEVILVPVRSSVGDLQSIYTLNEVGSFIWQSLDGKKRVEEIKDLILEEFDVSEAEAQEDLTEFIQQLARIEAIQLKD